MVAIQLEFWKTPDQCEIEALRKEMSAVKTSTEKVRKKLFCENGELKKKSNDLETRLIYIERYLCNPKNEMEKDLPWYLLA